MGNEQGPETQAARFFKKRPDLNSRFCDCHTVQVETSLNVIMPEAQLAIDPILYAGALKLEDIPCVEWGYTVVRKLVVRSRG